MATSITIIVILFAGIHEMLRSNHRVPFFGVNPTANRCSTIVAVILYPLFPGLGLYIFFFLHYYLKRPAGGRRGGPGSGEGGEG